MTAAPGAPARGRRGGVSCSVLRTFAAGAVCGSGGRPGPGAVRRKRRARAGPARAGLAVAGRAFPVRRLGRGLARARRGGAVHGRAVLLRGQRCVLQQHWRARGLGLWVQGTLAPALDAAAFLCFAAKILLGTRYTWRSWAWPGALYFIARWVHFNAHNIWWIGLRVCGAGRQGRAAGKAAAMLFAVPAWPRWRW